MQVGSTLMTCLYGVFGNHRMPAWVPQKERMDAGIYFPLFIVVVKPDWSSHAVYYLPANLPGPPTDVPATPTSRAESTPSWMGGLHPTALTCQGAAGRYD